MSLFSSAFDAAGAGPSSAAYSSLNSDTKLHQKTQKRKNDSVPANSIVTQPKPRHPAPNPNGDIPNSAQAKKRKRLRDDSKRVDDAQSNLVKVMKVVQKQKVPSGGEEMGISNRKAKKVKHKSHDLSKSSSTSSKPRPQNTKITNGDSGGGAGLTKMQKDMKAKLESARFRWINEQLYTTKSTDAVDMMKKDPKVFSDVGLYSEIADDSIIWLIVYRLQIGL
jgi:ribosomal RNA-processing protein 8